ncbi:MAG: GNAT family N-acetyltransferase [Sphingomonas sp.]|nr:GNAT family N-acetyltransferase [Sphingomonas sp.]
MALPRRRGARDRRVRRPGRGRGEKLDRRAYRRPRREVHRARPRRVLAGVTEDPALAAMCHAALLTIDGAPAAFSFDLDCGTLKYAIANSYDPAFAKHSPGKLLYWRNLAEAKARGIERVDWGAGDSGYKRVIGAAPGPMIRDWLLLAPGPAALVGRIAGVLWRRSGQTAQAAA